MTRKNDVNKFLAPRYKALELAEAALANPEALAILQEYFEAKAQHNATLPAVQAKSEQNGKKGFFAKNIRSTCEAFGSQEFTVKDVISAYESRGYIFNAADKIIAANTVLRRFVQKKILLLIYKGGGQQPSRYKYNHIQRFPREKGNGATDEKNTVGSELRLH
ncbi:MAG TPA: hypothetical protein VKP58_14955 [Candidatus Acidoferrum sp.]|nr:hypothetical protein [Candidatus Acidoferrum sp.]